MGNRADRRASVKIAKQAVKRAKSPTERAILGAAGAFVGEETVGHLAPHMSNADFDETWARLTEDLRDILQERYPDFLVQAFVEAGTGALRFTGAGGREVEEGTRLFLCPIVGPRERVAAFAASETETRALAASLRESGIVPETGACFVLPRLVSLASLSPNEATPGRVRALHDLLAHRLIASSSSGSESMTAGDGIEALLPEADASSGPTFAALVGIERVPAAGAADLSEDALDAEDLAAAAAEASWYDSYAADFGEISLGAPLDWPACVAALGWETVRVAMDGARARRGLPEGLPDTIRCAPSADGDRLVLSASYGDAALGPFSVPADLVWFDADAFFDRMEAGTQTLIEHEDEGPVIEPLLNAG